MITEIQRKFILVARSLLSPITNIQVLTIGYCSFICIGLGVIGLLKKKSSQEVGLTTLTTNIDNPNGRIQKPYTSQIPTPCFKEASLSARLGMNS